MSSLRQQYVSTTRLPGATKISCLLERMRRKVRSFCGSISLTVLLAFIVSWRRSPAYWTAVELSKVVLMGIPENIKKTFTVKLCCKYVLTEKAVVLAYIFMSVGLPSALTTIVPITPLWASILFSDSSTSACRTWWN